MDEAALDRLVHAYYASESVRARIAQNDGLRPWEREALARHHDLAAGREFLVLGGGAGRESRALAARGFSVLSVDRSEHLCELGRRRAGERERFACLRLPEDAPPPAFDHAALWAQLLANVPSAATRRAALASAAQSLQPGGHLSFSVHDLERTLALLDDSIRVEPLGAAASGDFVMTLPGEAPCYWHYFTRGEITELVRNAGLELDALVTAAELADRARANLWVGLCHRRDEG